MITLQRTAMLLGILLICSRVIGAQNPPILYEAKLPGQFRLAYAGHGRMSISWNTRNKLDTPSVRYGLTPYRLDGLQKSKESRTFSTSYTFSNHVVLKHLRPSTVYYYQVEGTDSIHSFKTAPIRHGYDEPFTFAVVVDLGTMGPLGLSSTKGESSCCSLAPGEKNTIQSLSDHAKDFEFVWHPGDIAYADYWLKMEAQNYIPGGVDLVTAPIVYDEINNAFYDELTEVTATRPYMVGPGNHEANCLDGARKGYEENICMAGQRNFTAYNTHWNMPSRQSGGAHNMWYSFDYGHAHFIQLNTETDLGKSVVAPDELGGSENSSEGPFGVPNEQIDWLKRDLAAVDRRTTPWVFVAAHRPWYDANRPYECEECRTAFERILVQNEVDLVFFGHEHSMQRWTPMAFNQSDPAGLNNPRAPWYIVNGAGGHYDGLSKFKFGIPPEVEFHNNTLFGWSKITVHNRTHVTHDFIQSSTGEVLDSAILYKEHSKPHH